MIGERTMRRVGATTNSQDGVTDLFGKCFCVLKEMVEQDLPLLVHGEVTNPEVNIFYLEKVYIETILEPFSLMASTIVDAVKYAASCKKKRLHNTNYYTTISSSQL
ncbi:putative dihydroorotase [Lupinus albus]|uniref:Putative dihydroorotase n=1 Tax=Lupinus albus TaxID=3870 RepID=A0A6A4Q1Y5_LUPAL|nr:putative dihydroorotase [Lupinus albus]